MSRQMSFSIITLTMIGFMFFGTVRAADFQNLTAQELKTKMDSGGSVMVVNPLSDIEFNEGHIPGSVNIPFHLMPTTDQLPEDKSTPIVTYCLGPKCIFYKKAAMLLADRGYPHVITFKGGVPAWVKAGFPLEQKGALAKTEIPTVNADALNGMLARVQIVDIRSPSLYAMGWIPSSKKIPLGLLSAEYADIPKDKPIVVVDHAGKQVLVAGRFLKSKGYDDVQRLQGGLMVWSRKGFALEP
ncbi:rhodanese-like domain-containing protein [Desulfosarcina ovata]|uniref:Transferase n=1 Tax=Desulfosarcina ovata subsp. ovata TaxID=2752305 RepID=A0A5K8AEL0_9BACT|nr:rhodanese-like domain-containing protein [Desulfosarcina ovata]BBO91072.1 transferase [Desulfosarcina ovata subsp. ovata]